MTRIYISGPITGNKNYMVDFLQAEKKLLESFRGEAEVINPARILHELPESATWTECMRLCYKLLDMADAVYMLPGWTKSKGACIEYGYALAKDKMLIKEEVSNGAEQGPEIL